MGERKTFATTIDADIMKEFKVACVKNEAKMNDVLEALMNAYTSGEIKISQEVKVTIQKAQKK